MDSYSQKQSVSHIGADLQDDEKRHHWRLRRSAMEWRYHKSRKYALWRFFKWHLMDRLERLLCHGLRVSGLYSRGFENATRIRLTRMDLHFSTLPAAFDGYRLLHLSDPHLDTLKDTGSRVAQSIKGIKTDLCVLTGDYRMRTCGEYRQVLNPMKKILDAVDARDGIISTLGNHDPHHLVDDLEAMGVTVLVNETETIARGYAQIAVTGLDDPHNYYTRQAKEALAASANGFKIALIHSPEMYGVAEKNGYNLYLCGHTHGGQISLPGGYPVITHLRNGRRFARGLWRVNGMRGYTNQGCGVVGMPVRFNTQSEVALITLKREPAALGRPDKS